MLRGAVDVWIGNAAAVVSGCWGAVTRRARETGYSRTAIYTHAQRVEASGGQRMQPDNPPITQDDAIAFVMCGLPAFGNVRGLFSLSLHSSTNSLSHIPISYEFVRGKQDAERMRGECRHYSNAQ